MPHLRFAALSGLLGAAALAGACSVYDESLLAAGGGSSSSETTASGDGGSDGEGGSGTTDASSTASGSTGVVTTGGGCTTVDECPGEDSACAVRACEDGVCSIQAEVQGVELPDQTAGDCVRLVCDGQGGIETVVDDADLPADDGNQCTESVCGGGEPDHVFVGEGDPCSQDGGVVCDGAGTCLACLVDGDCDGDAECSDTGECVAPQCNDGSRNGQETDTDCGGPVCSDCALGDTCSVDGDCVSGECNGTCQASCTDGVMNNGETGLDCGGPNCADCGLGLGCATDADCDSDQCLSNVCRPRIFFSEYVEGLGPTNNKALEIYNFGNVPLDLAAADCSVNISYNGGSSVGSIGLTGTVVEGEVHVLCSSAFVGTCDQTGNVNFNGDDALWVECMDVVLDVFGQIGTDPGSEWGTGLTSSADSTLRRNGGVTEGDRNGADPFDPAVEWVGFDVDTYGGLGEHP